MIDSLLNSELFQDIQNLDTQLVLSKFTEKHFVKNQVVFSQGEPSVEMYIVKSGSLQIYIQEDDKFIVVGHQFPGETIGELEVVHYDNHRLASVSAIENSVLWRIKKPDLEELLALYPALMRKLFFVVSERLEQANRKISYLAFLDSRLRMANLLLELHDNFGLQSDEGIQINWKVTQQHLANMIGVNRESAARALQGLLEEGVIQTRNKTVIILNLSKLKQIANDLNPIGTRKWHSTYKYKVKI